MKFEIVNALEFSKLSFNPEPSDFTRSIFRLPMIVQYSLPEEMGY